MADSEHGVNINITGNSTQAVGALGRVKNALMTVRSAVSKLTMAFGLIGLAVNGVQKIIEGYKALKEWMGRAAEQAKALRHEIESRRHEVFIANTVAAYDKLNKKIAETLKLERERNNILDKRNAKERDIEDANLELGKQRELSALNPEDSDYAAKKSAIERKYASKSSEVKMNRSIEDGRENQKKLYEQANVKDQIAKQLEIRMNKAWDGVDRATERRSAAWNAARGGNEEDKKRYEEVDKQVKEAGDLYFKIKEQWENALKEAQSLRNLAAASGGSIQAAKKRNEAAQMEIDQKGREAAAEQKKKDEEKQKKERKQQQATEDAALKRQKAEDISRLDPTSRNYERNKSEIERQYALKEAQLKEQRAEPEGRAAAEEERRTVEIENAIAKRDEMVAGLSDYRDRIAAADGVSQNRLTAMGLGSGVQANGGMANDVRKLVDLLKQEIDATKNIKPGDYPEYGVYGD